MKKKICILFISVLAGFTSVVSQIQPTSGPNGGNVLSLLRSGSSLFAGTQTASVFVSTNNGDSWTGASNGITEPDVTFLVPLQNFIFAITSQKIYRTSDNGGTWQSLNSFTLPPTCISVNGNNLYAGAQNSIYISTDVGISWNLYTNATSTEGRVRSIAFRNGAVIIAQNSISYSTNNGLNWSLVPLENPGTHVNLLYVLSNSVIACAQRSFFRNYDINSSWIKATPYVNEFISFTNIDQYLFAGHTFGGIFFSTNDGANWSIPAGFRVEGERINSLSYNTDYIFVGANTKVWRIPLTVLGLSQVSSTVPEKFNLHQNYPNPFNPATKIKLDISKASYVSLEVYNSLGQHVKELYSGELEAGSYEYDFNAEMLPSGVYYYRLVSGEFSDVKKLILLK